MSTQSEQQNGIEIILDGVSVIAPSKRLTGLQSGSLVRVTVLVDLKLKRRTRMEKR